MRYWKMFFFFAVPLLFCACLEVKHEIVVNKDGSGKITETVMISKAMLKQLSDIFPGLGRACCTDPERCHCEERSDEAIPCNPLISWDRHVGLRPPRDDSEGLCNKLGSEKIDIYDKKKLKADAVNYGPDAKYASSKRVSTKIKDGYEVVYTFNDIRAPLKTYDLTDVSF